MELVATTSESLTSAARRLAAPVILLATTATILLVEARQPALVSSVLALLLAGLLGYVARRHVVGATALGLVVIGAVPQYAGRYAGGTNFGITPALVVALVLLPAALEQLPRARFVPMDVAVGAFWLLRFLSTLLNFDNKIGSTLGPAVYLATAYGAFRLLVLRGDVVRAATTAVVTTGAGLGLFAVFEHAGAGNIFFRLPSTGFVYKDFAQEQLRFGEVRAEASFGHSIALGMFLALAMVLTVALAIEKRDVLTRAALVAAGGLILVGTLDTLSRGAILTLGIGLALWFLRESGRMRLSTLTGLVLVAGAVIVLTPLRSTVSELVNSSESSSSLEQASTQHRYVILDLVTDPAQFTLLGHQSSGAGGVTDQLEARTGLNSFDDAYALVYLANGLLTVVAFLGVGVIAFWTLVAPGLTALERAWVAALCAAAINLFTVNLLTQYQDFFWVAAAVSAGAWQRTRTARGARNRELVRSHS